jgi:hypothetical protein
MHQKSCQLRAGTNAPGLLVLVIIGMIIFYSDNTYAQYQSPQYPPPQYPAPQYSPPMMNGGVQLPYNLPPQSPQDLSNGWSVPSSPQGMTQDPALSQGPPMTQEMVEPTYQNLAPKYNPYASGSTAPNSPYWASDQNWSWTLLPSDIMYKAYLAGPRESRIAGIWNYNPHTGWQWDITLGGRVGIVRYGSSGVSPPEGWQLDMEAAAFPRLDLNEERDLVGTDYRFGIPLTYSSGAYQWKLAYYHNSSHVGDEYWEKNPTFVRRNYVRETMVLGNSYYLNDDWRIYGEVGASFYNKGGSKPWEFQYGVDYSPTERTGIRGNPFAAINGYSKQERDFVPTLTVQTGWQWRSRENNHLFRAGFQYMTGPTVQYEFLKDNEDLYGIGLWYDF